MFGNVRTTYYVYITAIVDKLSMETSLKIMRTIKYKELLK